MTRGIMFERMFAKAGLLYAKMQFSSEVDTVQPLTDFFSGARSVLIMLPIGYDDAVMAGNAMRAFRNKLQHLRLTVVNNSTRATALIDFPHCEVIRLDPGDINRFSLPTLHTLRRIFQRDFDVAIDMNLDFVLHTAYICRASRAKVRVGFSYPGADTFFNVQLNLDKQRSPQVVYEKFAACIGMF